MSVRGWAPGKEVTEPRGMWSSVAQKRKAAPSRASFMQNIRVSPGVVGPRPGTSAIVQTAGTVRGLFNWISATGSYVLYQDATTIKALLQPATVSSLLASIGSTYRPSFAEFDIWVYICGYDTDSKGTIQVEIYDGTHLDKAFRGPITATSVTPTDAGAGYCTEGTHYIAFVYQNRTGFAGVPTSKVQMQVGLSASTYPSLTPPTFSGTAVPATITVRPSATLNGWGSNAHEGAYEEGVDMGFGWGLNPDTTQPYTTPEAAVDSDPDTYATRGWAGSHNYAGCIWQFNTPTRKPAFGVQLKVLSEIQAGATGRSAGIWYSLDDGSSWVEMYNQLTHAKDWDTVDLPATQTLSRVQVMAFMDSHDTLTHYVYDVQITFTASDGDIHGGYESPGSGESVSGALTFSGFVGVDYVNVIGVLVYVDGHYIGQATYGTSRPDIAALYPNSPDNPNVGFKFDWSVATLAPGSHYWYAVAYLDDGRSWQTDSVVFSMAENRRKVNIAVTLPALADGGGNATLFLIATRTDNAASWYWMPDDTATGSIGSQPVPFNTPTTLNFVASYTDEDMAASLDSANEQFLLLTQDGSGNGPFNPSFVVPYGNRMCYGAGSSLYISDQQDPQHLTGDQHLVFNPSKRTLGYAFPLPGSTDLYLTGDRWTSRVTDSGDKPATWGPPIPISDALGAKYPACVCAKTGGNHVWIATEGGVYQFTGSYADHPVTYLVTDQWQRVNWNAAYAIEMADDVVGLRLYVAVPLDLAVSPTHVLVIDYTNGYEFHAVDISLDKFSKPYSSIAIVKETA